jgi:uncharacterized protein YbjT (DUF2867 family)
MDTAHKPILVTGGGTFLGDSIAAALLAEDVSVSLLVRPGTEDKLGPLADRVRWSSADVWNPASLRGRARGHAAVIHTVGSLQADPARGLTHHWLNFASARNVANMCVSDGCPHMVLLSAARAPWINRQYLRAKREAEGYIGRVGLRPTIIRAPVTYLRGARRHPFYLLMTALGSVPPTSWTVFGRIGPIPSDILARGVARLALEPPGRQVIFYAGDLRARSTAREARRDPTAVGREAARQRSATPFELIDEDSPFGWNPGSEDK